jgi:hypothetical protein
VTGLLETWKFTRERLGQSWQDLSHQQLLWRPWPGGHNCYEYLYHIAAAEHYWWDVLASTPSEGTDPRLIAAVRNGFLRDEPFPFDDEEFSREGAAAVLSAGYSRAEALLANVTTEQLEVDVESPLGPTITGLGGLVRMCQHAAYHTGQIWLLRQSPSFPAA